MFALMLACALSLFSALYPPDTVQIHDIYTGQSNNIDVTYDVTIDESKGDAPCTILYMVQISTQKTKYPRSIIAYDYDGDRTFDHLFIEAPDKAGWYGVTFLTQEQSSKTEWHPFDGSPERREIPEKLLIHAELMAYMAIDQTYKKENLRSVQNNQQEAQRLYGR